MNHTPNPLPLSDETEKTVAEAPAVQIPTDASAAQSSEQTPPLSKPSAQQQERAKRKEFFGGIRIYAFVAAMLILFVVGLLIFLRPEVSETEKRELTDFPTFTWESLISGEYFNGISTWYADTFPGREGLIQVNNAIRELFGIRTVQLIQSTPTPPDTLEDPNNGSTSGDGGTTVTPPIERLGSVYVKGDTAYEVYAKDSASSARYAELVSLAATQLSGKATVYDIIVPLSSSVNLSAQELSRIGASDAQAAIAEMYGQMSGVQTIDVLSTLRAHQDEYLYFRTDHHWTALGAYYAYTCYCQAVGITPLPLSAWTKYEFEGFLGTLYTEANQPQSLGKNPDTVEAWMPNGTNDIYITDQTGNRLRYRGGIVRTDTDTFYANAASKYNCFIMGDHPLAEIHNETLTDGSSIVVVKESFGNALIPFLVDHYEYVYVVDYRYFTPATGQTLEQFVSSVGCDTVLFINNLTATSASPRMRELERLLGA